MNFHTVTEADLNRSVQWARRTPNAVSAAIRIQLSKRIQNPMTTETREYLTDAVHVIERRARGRKQKHGHGKLKKWEQKLLDGAKRLLREEQQDLPLFKKEDPS